MAKKQLSNKAATKALEQEKKLARERNLVQIRMQNGDVAWFRCDTLHFDAGAPPGKHRCVLYILWAAAIDAAWRRRTAVRVQQGEVRTECQKRIMINQGDQTVPLP